MKKESHNMFSLMLDQKFKTLCIVSSLIAHEQMRLLKNMIKKNDFLFFLKCHYHLHPLAKSKMGVINHRIEKDDNLDIFVMTTNIIEPTLKLINRKLLISEWILKTSNVHFNGGKILKVSFIEYV